MKGLLEKKYLNNLYDIISRLINPLVLLRLEQTTNLTSAFEINLSANNKLLDNDIIVTL